MNTLCLNKIKKKFIVSINLTWELEVSTLSFHNMENEDGKSWAMQYDEAESFDVINSISGISLNRLVFFLVLL